MNSDVFNIKTLFLTILISLAIVIVLVFRSFLENDFVVFCDVGQGDAAYIRISNEIDILVDMGKSEGVSECLGKYMPIFDHTIELAIISHAHIDHYGGLLDLLSRYEIEGVIISPLINNNTSYSQLLLELEKRAIPVSMGEEKMYLKIGPLSEIHFMWPPKNFSSTDFNESSLVFIASINSYNILFTGDIPPDVLDRIQHSPFLDNDGVTILKVPHHGSKKGLTEEFLVRIAPHLSVISVAKNNRFGHPSPEVMGFFESLDMSVVTTAQQGDIKIDLSLDLGDQSSLQQYIQ